jgi:hypothetical protein
MLVVFPGILKVALSAKARVESDDLMPPDGLPTSESELPSETPVTASVSTPEAEPL